MSNHIASKIHKYPTTARDLARLFLGDVIGSGMSRRVYEHPLDPTVVVKHEESATFQNVMEWEIWEIVQYTKYAKYFAPCVAISQNGQFLIQKRAEQIPRAQYPKTIPSFFADIKYENFGKIGKNFVCIDYGTMVIRIMNNIIEGPKKYRKADWK